MVDVTDDADDFCPGRGVGRPHLDPPAHRFLIPPQPPRHRLVDDDDRAGCWGHRSLCKITPADESASPSPGSTSWTARRKSTSKVSSGRALRPSTTTREVTLVLASGRRVVPPALLHAGHRLETREELASRTPGVRRASDTFPAASIAASAGGRPRSPRPRRLSSDETAHEQARTDVRTTAERNLRGDKSPRAAAGRLPPLVAAAGFLQRSLDIRIAPPPTPARGRRRYA